MRSLLHMPFDPACRLVRLTLAEKGLPAQFIEKAPWDDPQGDIVSLNPAGTIPVLVDEPLTGGSVCIAPVIAIVEYLEDAYSATPLMPSTSAGRAETRRLCAWLIQMFASEASGPFIQEQIEKRLCRAGPPDYEVLQNARARLDWHFDYFSWLLTERTWFAGEKMTLADFAAAAHISTLDYLDTITWSSYPEITDWYMRIKSRPSFRPLLADRLDGIPPPRQYSELDF